MQCRGLIAGGVDAILIETCQDPLQIKAAVNGAKIARAEAGSDIPIFVQVTVETTGTLLVGPDIAAAATVVHALDVPLIGLNCATGPQEMAEHVRWLGENWPGLLSVQPNAGLPELVDGQTHYPLGAARAGAAGWSASSREDGVNLIGGCCGTDAQHIAALDAMLRRRAAGSPARARCARKPVWMPSVASLYQAVPLRQENAYLRHRRALQRQRLARSGASCRRSTTGTAASRWAASRSAKARNALDVCTAFVGRDEIAEMTEVIRRFTASVNAPLVIDSTETPVLEAALKLHGGKPIINSINFEDGEEARGRPAEAGEAVRRRGDRADHRRDRAWRRRPSDKLRGRAAAGRFRLQPARPAAVRSADRSADLHHRHRQRGRPQARRSGRWRASPRSATSSPTSRSSSACRISASA